MIAATSRWRAILAEATAEAQGKDDAWLAARAEAGLFVPPAEPHDAHLAGLLAALGDRAAGIETVLEVGPGYGGLTWAMARAGVGRRFILVDLPEALPFARAWLRREAPDLNVRFFSVDDFSDVLSTIDLAINVHSLGEMPQAAVDHVVGCIEDLSPRLFYSKNQALIDKRLFGDTGRDEANLATLPLKRPVWYPAVHRVIEDVSEGLPRNRVEALLVRQDTTSEGLLDEAGDRPVGSDAWLGFMYFAALLDRDVTDLFVAGLRARFPAIDVDAIGEVRYLRGDRGP